jgi:PadR family transcriptional regulator PadR
MRKQGLVSYVWEEAKTGHPRKYYALTDVGEQVLQQLRKVWQGIENTVHLLQN